MINYKEFRIGDVFEKLPFKKCPKDKNVSKHRSNDYCVPLVYAKSGDNGIMYYAKPGNYTTYSNVISIIYNGAIAAGLVYAHEEPTGILAESYFIRVKKNIHKSVPFNANLYLKTVLQKGIFEKYSRDNLATWNGKVENDYILLPIDHNGKIDFNYMNQYICNIKKKYLNNLEKEKDDSVRAFLKTSGLNSYELSNSELDFMNKEVKTKEYKLSQLFEIKSPLKRFNANAVKIIKNQEAGYYKYIVRSSQNNGQRGYIKEDPKYLSPRNTLAFGQDTATVFYQSEPYFTGDKIKIMTLKNHELNEKIALYLLTRIRKAFVAYSWGQFSFNENALKSTVINLPVDLEGNIDYKYMEKYIDIQQKLAITDMVNMKEIIINTTKKVILE